MAPKRGTKKAVVVEEPEELEELEDEFEELEEEDVEEDVDELEDDLDEEVEEEPAPKKRGRPAGSKTTPPAKKAPAKKAPAKAAATKESSGYDTNWLAEYVTSQTGQEYDGRAIRMVLRKLANDGELDRNVGQDRGRYEFTGPNDPAVKAVIRRIKSGAAAADKTERIEVAKASRTNKTAKAVPATKAPATKAAKRTRVKA